MTDFDHRRSNVRAADDHQIPVQIFEPADDTAVIIQILHGLGEHADRYARFAAAAAARNFAVCVHDHRGHGSHSAHKGHFADSGGWNALVHDARSVNQFARETLGAKPVVLLGHSMGSFIAQSYAMNYGSELAALILSGSTWPSRLLLWPASVLAKIESWRHGARGTSALLDKLGFDNFNKPFAPARTEFDWLSRDADEVDKYIADPLCGGPYTTRLWLDLLGGMREIANDKALSAVPAALPILITGGEVDAVGGDKGMTKLLQHYAQTMHQRLKVMIYAAARHELLNETNRDQVTDDWLNWIDTATRSARSG
ncbi:MAG: alpha/beta hydrolase [Gammaproteobacteria bacterium]|nr:alpha/beta hydrolase [Gammaproteobacteria bacterium]